MPGPTIDARRLAWSESSTGMGESRMYRPFHDFVLISMLGENLDTGVTMSCKVCMQDRNGRPGFGGRRSF